MSKRRGSCVSTTAATQGASATSSPRKFPLCTYTLAQKVGCFKLLEGLSVPFNSEPQTRTTPMAMSPPGSDVMVLGIGMPKSGLTPLVL